MSEGDPEYLVVLFKKESCRETYTEAYRLIAMYYVCMFVSGTFYMSCGTFNYYFYNGDIDMGADISIRESQ